MSFATRATQFAASLSPLQQRLRAHHKFPRLTETDEVMKAQLLSQLAYDEAVAKFFTLSDDEKLFICSTSPKNLMADEEFIQFANDRYIP